MNQLLEPAGFNPFVEERYRKFYAPTLSGNREDLAVLNMANFGRNPHSRIQFALTD